MISGFLAEFLPYILGSLAIVAGITGYGWKQKKAGRREVVEEVAKRDRVNADETEQDLKDLRAGRDGDARDRLRKTGGLRDGD